MGAIGVYNLAAEFPHKFSAIVPVCGSGEVDIAKKLKFTPVWAFHGENDQVTPIAPHKRLIDAIGKAGGQVKLSIVPGGTHGDIIFPVYNRQSIYDWLLAQKRHPKPEPKAILKPKSEISKNNATTPAGANDVVTEPKQLEIKKPKLPSLLNITQKASHRVKRGETLWGISKDYGVKLENLIKVNKLKTDKIDVDQLLIIPVKKED